jgi:AGZA family xanthine/uracil permease-like MFS transporter
MPAFLTILIMPVTGSITDGIIAGLFTYVVFSFIDSWFKRKQNKNRTSE